MPESANVRKLPSAAAPEDVPRAPEPLPVKPAGELLPAIREDGKVSMVRRESEGDDGSKQPRARETSPAAGRMRKRCDVRFDCGEARASWCGLCAVSP